jgi:Flp pilus assembly protein TadD
MKRGRPDSRRSRPLAETPKKTKEARARKANPELRGFFLGTAVMVVLAAAFLMSSGSSRRQPGSSTPAGSSRDTPAAPTGAEKDLQAAIARNPEDVEARLELARAYLKRRNLKEAWRETKEALRLSPGDARALTYEGLIRLNAGQPEAAVRPLKAAIEKNPDLIEPRLQLAYAYIQLSRPAEADATIAAAAERFPNKSDSIHRLAVKMRADIEQGAELP